MPSAVAGPAAYLKSFRTSDHRRHLSLRTKPSTGGCASSPARTCSIAPAVITTPSDIEIALWSVPGHLLTSCSAEPQPTKDKDAYVDFPASRKASPASTGTPLLHCWSLCSWYYHAALLASNSMQFVCVLPGDYQVGDVLGGEYTVVETLGRGSSGVTYKVCLS